jgi:type IV secretory pathway VirB10-like protein
MKFPRNTLSSFVSRATPLARPFAVATFAVLFSTLAMAQYVWLDATGRKVFSDQPPPNNIPAKRVLQDPGKPSSTSFSSAAAAANDDSATKTDENIDPNDPKAQAKAAAKEAAGKASDAVKKSAAKDKDLEAAKKKADDEVAAKKKAEDDARNVARVDNCVRAKQAKATLDSGVRLNQYNAKGESVFMDEAARAVETKRLEGILTADCK